MLENYFISGFFNAEILLKKTAKILLENCQKTAIKLLGNCQNLTVKFTLLLTIALQILINMLINCSC